MAQLVIGIILEIWFILAMVGGVFFYPPLSPTLVMAFSVTLLVPGVILIVLGRRRIVLFREVGGAVIASARKTGHIYISLVAQETRTSPDRVRLVVNTLVKKGIIPRDCEVS
jgi:hypothetical protein